MAIKRSFILSSGIGVSADNLFVVNNTNSVSSSTGSIVLSGGIGIGQSASISGRLQMFNGANYTSFVSSASGNTVYTLPATSPATGSSVLQSTSAGILSWVPMTATGGAASGNTAQNLVINAAGNASVFHPILFTPASLSSGSAVSSDVTISFNPSTEILNVSGLAITNSTASTNSTSGALIVTGGVGIGGNLYVSSATGISGVTINDGVVTGSLSGTASTATYSHQSGYAITSGSSNTSGLATTATNINVISASTNANHPLLFTPSFGSASGLAVSSNTTLLYNPSSDILSVSGAAITSTTASNTASTGALTVTGGVGIGSSVSILGRLQLFNGANYTAFVSSATGNTVYTLPATSPATGSSVLQSTSAGVLSWVPMVASGAASGNTSQNVVINAAGNANVFHPVLFTPLQNSSGSAVSSDSTISFNPSTEILNVSGLAITSGTASTNTTTGALVVRGGLGVTGQLSFATASFGFTGITTNPTMSFIGATSSSPITLTILTDNSLNFEGSQGSVFSIDSNLSSGEIFSVSDISGLPIISASAGQTVSINEFGGFTQIGNGSINSSSTTSGSLFVSGGLGITGNANIGGTVRITNTTNSSSTTSGALTVSGGVGIGLSASIAGRLQLFNGANYTAFVSSATGNTVYTLPATSPAIGTSYLTSTSAGILSWTAPSKTNYVLSFGAGFTPTASSADSVSLNIPYTPDGTTKYYYVKRIEYRNETLSGGTGLSFYLERHTSGNASWTITNRITAGSGASFFVGAAVYSSSFTTISSSAGVAASVVSGDYVRLFFTTVGSAANVSIAMTIEEQ